jgi:hypothetical protein
MELWRALWGQMGLTFPLGDRAANTGSSYWRGVTFTATILKGKKAG